MMLLKELERNAVTGGGNLCCCGLAPDLMAIKSKDDFAIAEFCMSDCYENGGLYYIFATNADKFSCKNAEDFVRAGRWSAGKVTE